MREYKQLTDEDRIEIYAMKQAGKQQNQRASFFLPFFQKNCDGLRTGQITRQMDFG